MPELDSGDLERIFSQLFAGRHATILIGGALEPLYQPPESGRKGRIVYRADFFNSALHEVAHWCVAGRERRKRVDYGYWYSPDGRSPQQQAEFERVEVKPQALEWVFAEACGVRFRPSTDNIETGLPPSSQFLAALQSRKEELSSGAIGGRALRFRDALSSARRVLG